jgi:hypothetical protein
VIFEAIENVLVFWRRCGCEKSGTLRNALLLVMPMFVGMSFGVSQAHELEEITVSRFVSNLPGFYEVEISGTVKGQVYVCALYSSDGALLASSPAIGTNLATKAIIQYSGNGVDRAQCVLN